jgi:RNA polymerase sigma factor (TIGR02999 family)
LPLVYEELRTLAAHQLAQEKPGQTLQATAVVHEAYLRVVDAEKVQRWNSHGHFFLAAAEAMRRILVDQALRRNAAKRGGQAVRADLEESLIAAPEPDEDVLAVNDALELFAAVDPEAAQLVRLRFFADLTVAEAAALGMSVRSAHDVWDYARSWLRRKMRPEWSRSSFRGTGTANHRSKSGGLARWISPFAIGNGPELSCRGQ